MVAIQRVATLDLGAITPLVAESRAEGITFIQRLHDEYANGRNRFDQPGEALFVALDGARTVGVCGLNRDPYLDDPSVGRVRHLYVERAHRRGGVARALMDAVLGTARLHFRGVTLRTENPIAARFYCSLGFEENPPLRGATHWRPFAR